MEDFRNYKKVKNEIYVSLEDTLRVLDEKFLLAQKREDYNAMTLIVDVKKQILVLAEK